IQITGQGGQGTGSLNTGVSVFGGGQVTSTGSAAITLDGTGGSGTDSNRGVNVEGAGSLVTSATGDIQITGQGGQGTGTFNFGVTVVFGGQVTSTGSAAITLDGTG